MLPGKPASLCSCEGRLATSRTSWRAERALFDRRRTFLKVYCEGSLLSLCHFLCLDWWLWIKTSFSCWYIFLFVKSFLMPRTSQPGICSDGTRWFLNPFAAREFCWKTRFEASWARFWPLSSHKDHKAVYRSYTSRPSDLDAKYQRPRFGHAQKGWHSSLAFSFRFLSSPLLWLFLPQLGELVELGLRNLSVRFSNISGYNTVYYASFILGYIEEILVEFEVGETILLIFLDKELRAFLFSYANY